MKIAVRYVGIAKAGRASARLWYTLRTRARPATWNRHASFKPIPRSGFSLIEMLVATVLAAVLMSAVLMIAAGVARDRRKLTTLNAVAPPQGVIELLRWDLSNAQSIALEPDEQSIVLIGVSGIDSATLTPNGRLVQVSYQLLPNGRSNDLWRVQRSLDDPAEPPAWEELVAANVSEFSLGSNTAAASPIPSLVRVQLVSTELGIDQTLWIK